MSQPEKNRHIEVALLRKNLQKRGYAQVYIAAALQKLETAAGATGITLYQANLRTFQLLRYGVPVQVGKSILIVLIVKWLMEFDSDARILIITDRDELDNSG